MAQLKDSLITGDLRVTGTIYGNVPLNDLVDADDLKAIEALTGTSGILKKTAANTWTLDTSAYTTTSGTVTSVRVQATSPVVSSVNTAQSTTLNTTISLADGYGDTKNPYASKTARYVLAAPASAAGAPSFRALTNADVGLGNVENTKLSTWAGSGNITTVGTLSSGTVPWARLSNVPTASTSVAGLIQIGTGATNAAAGNHNHDSDYVNVTGDSMTGRLTMSDGKPINQILTGSGTAGADNGANANPRYIPAKWTFNTGLTASDGDIFTIKIPVAGHSYGVYMSINNGANYYPVVLNGTGRITNHYAVNTYLQVIFESTGSAASMTPLAGANSANGSTITGGVFRVINYYDSGNNYNWVRPYYIYWKAKTVLYRYMMLFTYDEQYLLPANTTDNSTATTKTLTTESFDPYGDIYYYGNTGTINAGNRISDNSIYSMTGLVDLRYSFNTGTTLTGQKAVYLVMAPQSDGKVKLHTTPIVQALPTTDDGLLYKYIGQAYDTYRIQMIQEKPIYIFKNGAIRSYSGYAATIDWNNIYNTPTTLVGYGITDAATLDHVHGNITNDGKIGSDANKGVYTTTSGVLTAGTIPVAAGGTGATTFTSGALLIGNGTSAVGTRAITNNTSNTAITNNTNIPTMNTIYYGLVAVNGSSQTRATTIYAPTGTGTAGQFLVSTGSGTKIPAWKTVTYDKATSLTQSQNVTLSNATAATVTSAGTWPTLGTAFTIPNISAKTVVVSASATQISGDNYKLVLTTGDSVTTGTAFEVPNVTNIGTAPTFGTTTVTVNTQPTFTINYTATSLTTTAS